MYFGNVTSVTKVYIRRDGDGPSNTFQLLHSDDGINWKTGEKVVYLLQLTFERGCFVHNHVVVRPSM